MKLVRGGAAGCWLAAILVCLFAPAALGDGKVFRAATAVVPMVDQEAVICFKDGVEVLAIRTRVDAAGAKGEPLAWVVPVPAVPELYTTTQGAFDTARTITQPRLLQHTQLGLGWLMLFVSLFVLVAGVSLRPNQTASGGTRAALIVLWMVIGLVLAVVVFIPALAKTRGATGGAIGDTGVEVLKRERVGTLDVAVVRAREGAVGDSAEALSIWLEGAGCQVPTAAVPVLADYAARGWVFVAARLAQPASGERLEPTPLVLRFATPSPVYPMKLTGAGNGPLDLELCVIADATAAAPGMRVARSSPLYVKSADYVPDGVPLVHEGLRELASRVGKPGVRSDPPAWITRLTGRLTPQQQAADMPISISSTGERIGETLYTRAGARGVGAEWGAGLAAVGVLALAIVASVSTVSKKRQAQWFAACLAFGLIVCVGVAAAVPTFSGEVRIGRRVERMGQQMVYHLIDEGPAGLQNLRDFIAAKRAAKVEPYTSMPPEGDTPNGYTLRIGDDGGVWIDLYDGYGASVQAYPLSKLRR